jgi:hypothetical protein
LSKNVSLNYYWSNIDLGRARVELIGVAMKSHYLILALMVFGTASTLSHAEIYKWKDKNGVTRYSDTPPPSNVKQEAIGGKKTAQPTNQAPLAPVEAAPQVPANVNQVPPPTVSAEEQAAIQRQRVAEAEKRNKQEKEAEAKRKEENCKAARSNLETYTQGGRVYRMNEKGEREYMGDNDLKEGKAQAQRDMEVNCN